MKKIALWMLSAALLTACGSKSSQMPEANKDFAVETVKTTEADLKTSYPATIKGMQDIEIRPKVAGYLTKLLVDEGATVRKGQPLFLIDSEQYQAAVNSAKAQVRVCKANIATQKLTVENKQALFDQKIISSYDLQMAKNTLESYEAQLAAAQASLQSAQDNLRWCTVTSPSDGVVGMIPYRVGSLVSASSAQPLTTVSNISQMYVYFSMTEKQLLGLTREQGGLSAAISKMPAVSLVLSDGTEYSQSGVVSTVSGVIDSNTGSVQMRATFDNAGHVLRSGGTGSILIPIHQKDAIMIPQKATYEIQNKKFVYVVGADNKVQSREIEVLVQNDGQNYVVSNGLKVGERIVIDGVNRLKNDMQINPITPAQAKAAEQKAKQALKDGKMPGQE
ncbi:MAG: efflux RND transporter periplasmic adaptor subunit [Bacteroidales bacterium]|nr:efflux RND transporter periplasmic adaptor subunit [Bacteroidales bacterium]MDY4557472.1 efflux RND transporter periplasmic adaptor subunit [Alloprevotella sp.]